MEKQILEELSEIKKILQVTCDNSERIETNLEMMKKILFSYVVFQGLDVLQLLEKDLPEIRAVIFEHLHRSSRGHK